MVLKAVIFDFDGTLVDTLKTIANCGNVALSKNGFANIPEDKYRYLVGEGADKLIANMLNVFDVQDESVYEKVRNDYKIEYENNYIKDSFVYDGINIVLNQLKSRNIKLAILSNKPHDMTVMITAKLFGQDIFDIVCGKKDGVPTKPNSKGVELILSELQLKKEEVVFVGDTGIDMTTANGAGTMGVGVLWGFRDAEELKSAGAHKIIEEPTQLLELFINE